MAVKFHQTDHVIITHWHIYMYVCTYVYEKYWKRLRFCLCRQFHPHYQILPHKHAYTYVQYYGSISYTVALNVYTVLDAPNPRARNTQGRVCRESICNRVPWYEWYTRTLLLGPAFAIGRALMDKNGLHFYVRSSWLSWKGASSGMVWHHHMNGEEIVVRQQVRRWPSRQCIRQLAEKAWKERYPGNTTVCSVVIITFHIWAGV